MKPWEVLARTQTPDGTALTLTRHDHEYVIQADGHALMSSRMHHSEDALAALGCERARTLARPCVLVGGLGMGFTLRAALDCLPANAVAVVAELVPAVVEWNRGELGDCAQHPLRDPRVKVEVADVGALLRASTGRFDAVLLDVDNGPDALTTASNARLYDRAGLASARAALRPNGVLAIWSAREDAAFEQRLRKAGFQVKCEQVRARAGKGSRHTILLASPGRDQSPH
jgi:spermidine synthase